MLVNNDEYRNMLSSISREIADARARAIQGANAELVGLYWRIGKMVAPSIEYGQSYIDSLATDIRAEFPGIKGFSPRSIRYMVKFANEVDSEFCNSCCKIPWGHITHLLDKTEPGPARDWYVYETIENGWSRAVLVHQIELKLYERQALAGKVTNFERTLPLPESDLAKQALKDPYIFDFITARQDSDERDLEDAMTNNVTKTLLELGTGFAFMGRQYHLVVGGEDFYIDLLFYNTKLKCYFVVELKAVAFKPEYAGKLNFYLSAIDDLLCDDADNPTIGLLLCKDKNNVVAEYSLKDLNKPIGVSEYKLSDVLPEGVVDVLPSSQDLEARV